MHLTSKQYNCTPLFRTLIDRKENNWWYRLKDIKLKVAQGGCSRLGLEPIQLLAREEILLEVDLK